MTSDILRNTILIGCGSFIRLFWGFFSKEGLRPINGILLGIVVFIKIQTI